MNRFTSGMLLAGCAIFAATSVMQGAKPACDADNGGITLPAGFCAFVAADGIGSARHLVVAPNGDVYVTLMGGRGGQGGGVVALRDKDGDGRLETKETFGKGSSTGVALRNGYLYVATTTTVERYKMTPGTLAPTGPMETIVTALPVQRMHEDKGIAFDGKGSLYINVGAPSNACQARDRSPKQPGQDPCPILEEHGGIWKFDENRLNQKMEDGTKYATGLRQMPAITWHDGALYIVMNNRDQIDTLWPDLFKTEDNATRPAEPMFRAATAGLNFGWPFCFYDYGQKKSVLNPEYGGDGTKVGRCTEFAQPIAAFPAHWAPVDVMFYDGTAFPAKYRNGAFIAFHGSWNRAPMPQDGYNVTFQPFSGGNPAGNFEIFANGFAGKSPLMNPNDAGARADGVAQAPDGSLYICESQKGKIWRVIYKGGK